MTQSFLHNHCKAGMCQDCIDIAEEYQELELNRKRALMAANDQAEKAIKDRDQWKRQAEMYEQVAKAGIGDIIAAWVDKEIKLLLGAKP